MGSPLLTDEAVRAVYGPAILDRRDSERIEAALHEFLRYHATEGREVLAEYLCATTEVGGEQIDEILDRLFGAVEEKEADRG